MNQQGSQKIDAYRRASSYPAPVSSICRITTLLRRPLKREDVKRKLIAHKNCIHEIGQDWGADIRQYFTADGHYCVLFLSGNRSHFGKLRCKVHFPSLLCVQIHTKSPRQLTHTLRCRILCGFPPHLTAPSAVHLMCCLQPDSQHRRLSVWALHTVISASSV